MTYRPIIRRASEMEAEAASPPGIHVQVEQTALGYAATVTAHFTLEANDPAHAQQLCLIEFAARCLAKAGKK